MMLNRLKFSMLSFVLTAGLMSPLLAQENGYLDNRSTPHSLIASYFNALNAYEFARAWSYWDLDNTSATYETFLQANHGVTSWEVKIGAALSEGAAGSVFSQVPFAMVAKFENGKNQVSHGCFVIRAVNASIQEPPFEPIHFWGSHAREVNSTFEETELGLCN